MHMDRVTRRLAASQSNMPPPCTALQVVRPRGCHHQPAARGPQLLGQARELPQHRSGATTVSSSAGCAQPGASSAVRPAAAGAHSCCHHTEPQLRHCLQGAGYGHERVLHSVTLASTCVKDLTACCAGHITASGAVGKASQALHARCITADRAPCPALPPQAACLAELLLPATQALYSSCVEYLAAHFEEVHCLGPGAELSLLPAAVMADVLSHAELAVLEQKVRGCKELCCRWSPCVLPV